MEWEKRQKFSIRKFTIGAASVMIGQFYLGTVTNAPSVSADERSRADVEVVTLPQDEQLNHVTLPAEKTAEQAPATTQETSVEEKLKKLYHRLRQLYQKLLYKHLRQRKRLPKQVLQQRW